MVCSHYKLYMKAKKGNLSPRLRHDVDTTFYTRLAELQVRKRQRDSGVGGRQVDGPVDDGGEDEDDGSDDAEGSEDEEDSDGGDKEDPEDSSDAKDSDGSSGDDKASDDDKDESEVGDILVSLMRLTYPANR